MAESPYERARRISNGINDEDRWSDHPKKGTVECDVCGTPSYPHEVETFNDELMGKVSVCHDCSGGEFV